MKKAIIASLLTIGTTAFAGDVTVSGVRDYNVEHNGFRVGTTLKGITLSATHIDQGYNRYAVGKDFALTKVGPVALSAGGSVSFQDTFNGADGYGLTVGATATMPVTKTIDVVASVERSAGQERISKFNGNTGAIGLKVKF